MTTQSTYAVVTTVQPPSDSMFRLAAVLRPLGIPLLVVGDKKGPASYAIDGSELITLSDQEQLGFALGPLLPTGHYVRKNLGYLLAMRRGAECIYETDDDNAPDEGWRPRGLEVMARRIEGEGWFNVYRLFSEEMIWPRGLPLDKVASGGQEQSLVAMIASRGRQGTAGPTSKEERGVTGGRGLSEPVDGFEQAGTREVRRPEEEDSRGVEAPIQQGLVNNSPDVDAVWRLLFDRPFSFQPGPSVILGRHAWCPFNSQSTWWWRPAFPLMYLPSHCSFRMTDIWRSLIAQRCLWEFAQGVVFHGPEVVQERNAHNLMRDFADEVPGYLQNDRIAGILQAAKLLPGALSVERNLLICYDALIAAGIFPAAERDLVKAWISDLKCCVHAPCQR